MVSALFFTYAAVTVLTTVNALRRPSPPTSRFPALWLPAMLTAELAPFWVVMRVVVAAMFVGAGGLRLTMGWIALLLVAAAQIGLLAVMMRARRVTRTVRSLGAPMPVAPGWARILGRPGVTPPGVERVDGIPYHADLTLDLYLPSRRDEPSPAVIYVHGGSWTGGDPHRQGRTLFHHLARQGWIVATIRYPLSPTATFPDHLIGVKQAIAWAKTGGAASFGIDPGRVAIAGGSAGAHLAALAALTPDDDRYQPGFGEIDTSVAACIAMYGVYDFLNRNHTRWDWPVIPRHVMKAGRAEAEALYRDASPLDRVNPDAPPFMVIHGSHDSLVPPAEAGQFVRALEETSRHPVEYLEVFGGQHGFDALESPRTRAVAAAVGHFLDRVTAVATAPSPDGDREPDPPGGQREP